MSSSLKRVNAGVIAGAVIALAIPVSNGLAAMLWDNGLVQLDPEGWLVKGLEAPGLAGILFGPIGIVIAGWFGRARSFNAWFVLIVLAIPLLTVVWFYAIASLGGLAGEPF
jgi:hypothetical protein